MVIAVDFDGTCVKHEYPNVGEDVPFAVETLRKLIDIGNKIILYTMRSGKELEDAVNWFRERKIPLYGIQKEPTQHLWTNSPKCHAQIYIDDAALGCPLIRPSSEEDEPRFDRPYVDWVEVRKILFGGLI